MLLLLLMMMMMMLLKNIFMIGMHLVTLFDITDVYFIFIHLLSYCSDSCSLLFLSFHFCFLLANFMSSSSPPFLRWLFYDSSQHTSLITSVFYQRQQLITRHLAASRLAPTKFVCSIARQVISCQKQINQTTALPERKRRKLKKKIYISLR